MNKKAVVEVKIWTQSHLHTGKSTNKSALKFRSEARKSLLVSSRRTLMTSLKKVVSRELRHLVSICMTDQGSS